MLVSTRRIAIALLASTVLLGACSSPDAPADTAIGDAFPRTVEHFRGQTVVPEQPRRIVSLDSSYSDAVLLLGGNLVGYADYRGEGLPNYLGAARETEAADAVSVGAVSDPSMEKVAALEPDLILSADVRDSPRYSILSNLAPTVFSQTTGPTWKDNIRLAGRAMGKEAVADAKIGEYEARARAIGADIRAKAGDPSISIVRFAGEPTARLYRTSSFSGVVLQDAGLTRPQSQQADAADTTNILNAISPELIGEAEADVIFVSTTGDGSAEAQPFLSSPLWTGLRGRKIDVDDSIWMLPVSVQGAHKILDDLADAFGVDRHPV